MRRDTAGTVQLEEGKAQGYLINVYKYIYTWRENKQTKLNKKPPHKQTGSGNLSSFCV